MRQDLLKKIQQMIYNFPASNSVASAYAEVVKTILELTQNSTYKAEKYSKYCEGAKSISSNNRQDINEQISNLVYSDNFLIPIGQKS